MGIRKGVMPKKIITMFLVLFSSSASAFAHPTHHGQRLRQLNSFDDSYSGVLDQRAIRVYQHPSKQKSVVGKSYRPRRRRWFREDIADKRYRRQHRNKNVFHQQPINHYRNSHYRGIKKATPVARGDNNNCIEGSVIGGILGAGLGAVLSRGDGRWIGVPLGTAAGALVGCQVDGG